MKTFDDCKKEIEMQDPDWNKRGLPKELYYLAFLRLGIDHYICTEPDSCVAAESGMMASRELEQDERCGKK